MADTASIKVVMVDLFPSPASDDHRHNCPTDDHHHNCPTDDHHHNCPTDDHHHHCPTDERLTTILASTGSTSEAVHVYILTSLASGDLSNAISVDHKITSGKMVIGENNCGSRDSSIVKATTDLNHRHSVETTVVSGESSISSFYKAKQLLDDLDATVVKLVCHAERAAFWISVCQLLFTPVHDWTVVTDRAHESDAIAADADDLNVDNTQHGSGANSVVDGWPRQSEKREAAENDGDKESLDELPILEQSSPTMQDGGGNYPNSDSNSEMIGTANSHHTTDAPGWLPRTAPETVMDEVKREVQSFLQSLPSVLGVPEVERSGLLPGKDQGFVHGYSTRRGGVTVLPTVGAMNVYYTDRKRDSQLVIDENRRRLAMVGGFNTKEFHIVRVEHGHQVWVVGDDPPDRYDAIVTDRYDVTIAGAGADCIPVLFADPMKMVIGAAHAGWKGTVERVAVEVVRTMQQRFGCNPEDIRVALGPAVRPGCFTVLEEEGYMFSHIHPSCLLGASYQPVSHLVDAAFDADDVDRTGTSQRERDSFASRNGHGLAASAESPELSSCFDLDTDGSEQSPAVLASVLNESPASRDGEESRMKRPSRYGDGKASATTGPRLIKLPGSEFQVLHLTTEQLRSKTARAEKDPAVQRVHVDLQLANYHALLQAGVKGQHIDMSTSHCTKCNPLLYYSNERDGFPFGNQIGFICMPSNE